MDAFDKLSETASNYAKSCGQKMGKAWGVRVRLEDALKALERGDVDEAKGWIERAVEVTREIEAP